jgi:hypothetical protein
VRQTTPTTVKAMALTLAVAGMVSTATGCSGSSGPPSKHSTPLRASSASAAPSGDEGSASHHAPALPSGVTAATAVPTKVANKAALRKNVTLSTCKTVSGGWGASGTARNPLHRPATYSITVFFTTTHATVIGNAATRVHLKAEATKKWSVSTRLHTPSSTLCVLRGVG